MILQHFNPDNAEQIGTIPKAQTGREMAVPLWHHAGSCGDSNMSQIHALPCTAVPGKQTKYSLASCRTVNIELSGAVHSQQITKSLGKVGEREASKVLSA